MKQSIRTIGRWMAATMLMAGVTAVTSSASPASAKPKPGGSAITYTLAFANGKVITGTATSNDVVIPNAGGSSVTNPTGMTLHVSCSDPFTGGWGTKQGPKQGIDTAWQLKSFYIVKGSKTCGDPSITQPVSKAAIDVEKYVKNDDADTAPGPMLVEGQQYTYTYKVTNTGDVTIQTVKVTDSEYGAIFCMDSTPLPAGASRWCQSRTFTAESTKNPHPTNATVVGTATVEVPAPPAAGGSKSKSISYALSFMNGKVITGTATSNDVVIPNAGGSSVTNPTGMTVHVSCSDPFTGGWGTKQGPKQGIDTAWQLKSFYIVKGSKTCGSPIPTTTTVEVRDEDPAHYTAKPDQVCTPSITMELYIAGQDADAAPGPSFPTGSRQMLTYKVINSGPCPLVDVWVNDIHRGKITCPSTNLQPGQTMWCTSRDKGVLEGQNFHQARANGRYRSTQVIDRDPVYFVGVSGT